MNRILVVIDMQRDFISGALAAQDGQQALERVAAYVRDFAGRVLYTLDTHDEGYVDSQEGRNLPVSHCRRGTWGWEVPEPLATVLREKQARAFEKPSFGSATLALTLTRMNRRRPIDEIVLMGICTDICVVTNALTLKTFLPETPITVVANACAGVTRERHQAALTVMACCQIQIVYP